MSPKDQKEDQLESKKIFGFIRSHPYKAGELKSHEHWAQGKAISDLPNPDDRPYWRIHDNLYDLTHFNHPGGNDWIQMSKGNDITELFESCHPNIDKVRGLLPKYLIRKINEPRNSGAFTFDSNGFYSIFRQRAWEILKVTGTGPTFQMLFIHDTLLIGFLGTLILAINPFLSFQQWIVLSMISGFILQCLGTCSHNFYHQKQNWRMYSWDLTPASSYEWRISHAYSHHTFPNTAYDFEVMMFRPFLYFYPEKKSIIHLLSIPIILQIVCLVGMHLQGVQRFGRLLTGKQSFRWEHLLPFLLWGILGTIICRWYGLTFNSLQFLSDEIVTVIKQSFYLAAIRLNVTYFWSSFFFHNMSLGTGHHHPLIWHEGDSIPSEMDWGIFQIIAVVRVELIDHNLFLTSVTFGNHILHHLLPTVDHSKLPLVRDVFIKTCKEFSVDFNDEWFEQRKISPFFGWIAMVQQLFRGKPADTNFPSGILKENQQPYPPTEKKKTK